MAVGAGCMMGAEVGVATMAAGWAALLVVGADSMAGDAAAMGAMGGAEALRFVQYLYPP